MGMRTEHVLKHLHPFASPRELRNMAPAGVSECPDSCCVRVFDMQPTRSLLP